MPLHARILLGMVLGVLAGAVAVSAGAQGIVVDWVKPLGVIFINALKMIAVPLILASLVKGVADLKDLTRLSSIGGRAIGLYLFTTVAAVAIGLLTVNLVGPGRGIDQPTRERLVAMSSDQAQAKIAAAENRAKTGPLQPLVDLVTDNVFASATDNGRMLQVIVFALLFGVGLILIAPEKAAPVVALFDGLNEVILKLIDLVMLAAPVGVFALLATLVAETPSIDVFKALLLYSLCVVGGLAVLLGVFYPALVYLFAGKSFLYFVRGIAPAQLVAFSTSSSAATLPVTMERVEEHLGVDEEVASFVLPIGATVNMDGTSLYQGVASVFVAQVFGVPLTLGDQLSIVVMATMASIGSAAVPGAGMVMLVGMFEKLGLPVAGIALIFAVDRVLDMCRTVANVTGDAAVATIVAKSVGKLHDPQPKDWDDTLPGGGDS